MPVFSQSKRKVVEKTIADETLSFYQLSARDRLEYFESSKGNTSDPEDGISIMRANLESASLLIAYSLKPGKSEHLYDIQEEIKELPDTIINEMYEVAADLAGFAQPGEEEKND